MEENTASSRNVVIGAYAGDYLGVSDGSATDNVIIGDSAATNGGGNMANNICLGSSAGTDSVFAFGNNDNNRIVIGNNKSELAKIGGITPAVFIFKGKCDELATLLPAPCCCLFGY